MAFIDPIAISVFPAGFFQKRSGACHIKLWPGDSTVIERRSEEWSPDRSAESEEDIIDKCIHVNRHTQRVTNTFISQESMRCLFFAPSLRVEEQFHYPAFGRRRCPFCAIANFLV